jgi:hypothetical protein
MEYIEDDDEFDVPCLVREECIKDLIKNSPPGCLYCELGDSEYDDFD